LSDEIGSIEPGKQADLCAVDLGAPLAQPCFDPVSHLVYVAGREHVSHVWVGGQARVDNGRSLLQISDKELLRLTSMWHTKIVN
jgi:5-methylthioadenosine/S-adenosylhomocysteine deaminase